MDPARFPNLHVSHHPLVEHKLSLLRDRTTEPKKFRELVRELSWLLGYEAMADLTTQRITVETPLEPMAGAESSNRRSGLSRCCAPAWGWWMPCSS